MATLAFSPDGATLATGGQDTTVRLWDGATGEAVTTLSGPTGSVATLAFSTDGATLATGGDDDTARLGDAATGDALATLPGHIGSVRTLAFSPNGATLAAGSGDGTVRLWDMASFNPKGWSAAFDAGEVTVWSGTSGELLGATEGAWRHLGYSVRGDDGRLRRLPAETLGPLPPLRVRGPAAT